jgi:ABC-type sugar transport system, periplasmic component
MTGCNKTKDTEADSKVTIKFWQAGGDTAGAADKMSEIIKKFETANPNIKVEYQAIPWAENPHDKFQTAIAGNEIADLLIVGSPFDFVLADSGTIVPLDQYMDNSFKTDLLDTFLKESVYTGQNKDLNGKTISIPMYGDVRTIVYNKDLFKAAGVSEPTESWTFEQFKANAIKLTKDTNNDGVIDQYGFGTSANYTSQYLPFVWDKGGEILSTDMTKAAVTTDAWKEGIKYYIDLLDNKVSPPGSANLNLTEIQKLFGQGKIAMFVTTQDYVKELVKDPNMKDKIGIGQLPHDQKQTAFAGADVLVIPKQSKYPKQAYKLLRYIVSTENEIDYCKTVGFMPALKSAAKDPYFANDPIKKGFMQALEKGKFYVKSAKSSAITTTIKAEVQNAISKKKTVDQALQDIDKAINTALTQ